MKRSEKKKPKANVKRALRSYRTDVYLLQHNRKGNAPKPNRDYYDNKFSAEYFQVKENSRARELYNNSCNRHFPALAINNISITI
jgi:hypothetical protein